MLRAGASSPEAPRDTADHISAVFAPRSVAVLGVTATPGTVPYDIFLNILNSPLKNCHLVYAARRLCEASAGRGADAPSSSASRSNRVIGERSRFGSGIECQ